MSEDKKELEGLDGSMDLPDAEALEPLQDHIVTKKRKGGRKPERKQRNRQAQAAFRERRTEYIKQLEETIRIHGVNLHNVHTARQSAAEECVMLRYKNSLLERILLEKGIDVRAELEAKTTSLKVNTNVQRDVLRTSTTHSNSSITPKIEPKESHRSPQSHPMPLFLVGSTPTLFGKHYEQLEQEYETQTDVVDDEVLQSGPGPYPGSLDLPPQLQIRTQSIDSHDQVQQLDGSSEGQSFETQPLEPMLDMDPFGLSASMKFPTQFSLVPVTSSMF